MSYCERCGCEITVKFKGYVNLPFCYSCRVKEHSKGITIKEKMKRLKEQGVNIDGYKKRRL